MTYFLPFFHTLPPPNIKHRLKPIWGICERSVINRNEVDRRKYIIYIYIYYIYTLLTFLYFFHGPHALLVFIPSFFVLISIGSLYVSMCVSLPCKNELRARSQKQGRIYRKYPHNQPRIDDLNDGRTVGWGTE